jgi:hypothetical protein
MSDTVTVDVKTYAELSARCETIDELHGRNAEIMKAIVCQTITHQEANKLIRQYKADMVRLYRDLRNKRLASRSPMRPGL